MRGAWDRDEGGFAADSPRSFGDDAIAGIPARCGTCSAPLVPIPRLLEGHRRSQAKVLRLAMGDANGAAMKVAGVPSDRSRGWGGDMRTAGGRTVSAQPIVSRG